jgi:hypothetical protein
MAVYQVIVAVVYAGVEERDRHIAATIQFHVGNRCYFYIDGKQMNGEIASLNIKPGTHLVRCTLCQACFIQ